MPETSGRIELEFPVLTLDLRTRRDGKAVELQRGSGGIVLRHADEGATIGEVCRKVWISEAAFYVWRKKYAGLMPSEMKRLNQLEDENDRLKRIVADLTLDR